MTAIVCGILCWIFVEDLWRFRIRNVLVVALVVCFLVDAIGRHQMWSILPHAILAAVGFFGLGVCFALRMIGGGDAKLLSVALLWVGPEGCTVFAAALFVFTLLYVGVAWAGWAPTRSRTGRTVIPFGPSIAAAWIAFNGISALTLR